MREVDISQSDKSNMKAYFLISFFVSIVGNLLALYLTFYAINNNLGYEGNSFKSFLISYSFLADAIVSVLIVGLVYLLVYFLIYADLINVKYASLLYFAINSFFWYDFLGDFYVVKYNINIPFNVSLIYFIVTVSIIVIITLVKTIKTEPDIKGKEIQI